MALSQAEISQWCVDTNESTTTYTNARTNTNTKENTMGYIKAEDVRSPKGAWNLIHVLVDNGPSTDDKGGWSLSVGTWYNEPRLAARWNGYDGPGGSPAGNPQSRGIPTWFIVPPEFEKPLMAVVPADKLALAKALLRHAS